MGTESKNLLDDEAQWSSAYKLARVVLFFSLWTMIGMFSEVTGPAYPELVVQTKSNYIVTAQALSMRGAGHIIGGLVGAVAIDQLFEQVDVCSAFIVLAYTGMSVVSSYVTSVPLLFAVFLAQGSLETYLGTAACRSVMKLWKSRAAVPLQVTLTGYSAGSLLSPLIAAPFLDARFSGTLLVTRKDNDSWQLDNRSNQSIPSHGEAYNGSFLEFPIPLYPARFTMAYWNIAILGLTVTVLYLMFYIHGKVSGQPLGGPREQNSKPILKRLTHFFKFASCSTHHPGYAAAILVVLFLYYMLSLPLLRAFAKFIYSYGRDALHISVHSSALLNTSFFISTAISGIIAGVGSHFIHMKYIVLVEVFGSFTCSLLLFFHSNDSTTLWLLIIALGLFSGAIISSAFAWLHNYIEVTASAQMVAQLGAATGDLAIMSAMGYSYENDGPNVLWSYVLFLTGCLVVVVCIGQVLCSLHGEKPKRMNQAR